MTGYAQGDWRLGSTVVTATARSCAQLAYNGKTEALVIAVSGEQQHKLVQPGFSIGKQFVATLARRARNGERVDRFVGHESRGRFVVAPPHRLDDRGLVEDDSGVRESVVQKAIAQEERELFPDFADRTAAVG